MTLTGNCSDTGVSGCVSNSTRTIPKETNESYSPPPVQDKVGNCRKSTSKKAKIPDN